MNAIVPTQLPRRIVILGCSGAGKSTLASLLAGRLGIPDIPTDHIYWTNDWKPVPAAEVRAWAEAVTATESWVFDGNFDAHRDLVWGRAELAVWLDLPLITTTWRVLRRNFQWWLSGEAVWGGQRMSLRKVASGVLHVLRSHGRKRKNYPKWLAAFPHLRVVRITSSRQLVSWLDGMADGVLININGV